MVIPLGRCSCDFLSAMKKRKRNKNWGWSALWNCKLQGPCDPARTKLQLVAISIFFYIAAIFVEIFACDYMEITSKDHNQFPVESALPTGLLLVTLSITSGSRISFHVALWSVTVWYLRNKHALGQESKKRQKNQMYCDDIPVLRPIARFQVHSSQHVISDK